MMLLKSVKNSWKNGDTMEEELRKINDELSILRRAILGEENGSTPGLSERIRDNEFRIKQVEGFCRYLKNINLTFVLAMVGIALRLIFGD